jgi:hypothetical protein
MLTVISEEEGKAEKPRWKKRILRLAIRLLVFVGLLIAAGWFAVPLLKPYVERAVENQLGLVVRIGSLRGFAFVGITADDVRLSGEGRAPMVRGIRAEQVVVEYDLLGLLTGSSAWLERVVLDGVDADIDLVGELPAVLRSSPDTPKDATPGSPFVMPVLEIRGRRIALHHPTRSLTLENPVIRFRPGAAGTGTGEIRVGRTYFTPAGETPELPSLSASVVLDNGTFLLTGVRTGGKLQPDDRIRITMPDDREDELAVDANLTCFGGQGRFDLHLRPGELRANIRLDKVQAAYAAMLLPKGAPRIEGLLDVDARLHGPTEDPQRLTGHVRTTLTARRIANFNDVKASLAINIDEKRLRVQELLLRSREGQLNGWGALAPGGKVSLALHGQLDQPGAFLPGGAVGSTATVGLEVSGTIASPAFQLKLKGEQLAHPSLTVRDYELEAVLEPDEEDSHVLSIGCWYGVLAAYGVENRNGNLRITLTGTPSAATVALVGHGQGYVAEASGRIVRSEPDRTRITLENLTTTLGASRFQARGPVTVVVEPGTFKLEQPELTVLDRPARLEGGMKEGKLDLGVVVGALKLEDVLGLFGLRRRGSGIVDIDLKIAGTPKAPELRGRIGVNATRFELEELGLPVLRKVQVDAAFDPGVLRLRECRAELAGGLVVATGEIGLEGFEPMQVNGVVDFRDVRLLPLGALFGQEIAGEAGGRVEVKGRLDRPVLGLQAEVTNVAWEPWQDGTVRIEASYRDGEARFKSVELEAKGLAASGSLTLPIGLSLKPPSGTIDPTAPIRGTASARLSPGSPLHEDLIDLETIDLELDLKDEMLAFDLVEIRQAPDDHGRLVATGRVAFDGLAPRALDIKAETDSLELDFLRHLIGERVGGTMDTSIVVAGPVKNPTMRLVGEFSGVRYRDLLARSVTVEMWATDGRVHIEHLGLETDAGELEGKGDVPLRFSLAPPELRADRSGPLRLEARGSGLEPGRLFKRVGPFRRLSGPLGLEARVSGSMQRPVVSGCLDLDGMAIKFMDEVLPGLQAIRGKVFFSDRHLETRDLVVQMGHEPAVIIGRLDFRLDPTPGAKEGPLRFVMERLNATARGRRLLLLKGEEVRFRADVVLRCRLTPRGGLIAGKLTPVRSRYFSDIPLKGGSDTAVSLRLPLPRLDTEFGRNLKLDLRVEPGQGVLFDTNVARVRARPDFVLTGTAADPILDGSVVLNGKLFAPAATFNLVTGDVAFHRRDPLRPYVNAVARSRIAGVEVQVTANGPLDHLKIDFASHPYLPREDIAALVMVGVVRQDFSEQQARDLIGTQGIKYLYNHFFPRQRGEDRSFFTEVIDRFHIRSIPPRNPREPETQVYAQFRVLDFLYLQGENDRYGYYNGDVLFRFKFGGSPETPAPAKADDADRFRAEAKPSRAPPIEEPEER